MYEFQQEDCDGPESPNWGSWTKAISFDMKGRIEVQKSICGQLLWSMGIWIMTQRLLMRHTEFIKRSYQGQMLPLASVTKIKYITREYILSIGVDK